MSDGYKFADFHLDCINDRLFQDGTEINLAPKAFALLRYLIEQQGRLVRKNELLDAVWSNVIVGDAVLKVCIAEIRKALKDHAQAPVFIETVHRRGYRFIAKIQIMEKTNDLIHNSNSGAVNAVKPIGREGILEQLSALFGRAQKSYRQLVFLSGDPGVGKTTVIESFARDLPDSTLACLGMCMDHSTVGEAYFPFLDALGQLCRGPDREYVIGILRQYAPSWVLQIPSLETKETKETEGLKTPVSQGGQSRMLREFAEALEVITARRPLVIILEDMHWSDIASIELLEFIARRSQAAKLLVVASYRPFDILRNNHAFRKLKQVLHAKRLCCDIPVGLLNTEQTRLFLTERFGNFEKLEKLTQALEKRTEGNPLFMINVVRYLVDQGILRKFGRDWQLNGELRMLGVPDTLSEMIVEQFDCLDTADLEVMQILSVSGGQTGVAELADVLGSSPSTVEKRCEKLTKTTHFLERAQAIELANGHLSQLYRFTHSLYQHVLYEQIEPSLKIKIHRSLGLSIEAIHGSQTREIALSLAQQFTRGREFRKAAHYWHFAAETSIQRQAYKAAIEQIGKALILLRYITDKKVCRQTELDLLMLQGPVLIANEGNASPAVGNVYKRACDLSEKLMDDHQLFPALFGLRSFYQFTDQWQNAVKCAQNLQTIAERTHNIDFKIESCVASCSTYYFLGDLKRSQFYAGQGITLYKENQYTDHVNLYGMDPGVLCLSRFAQVSWLLGDTDTALETVQKAVRIGYQLDHIYSQIFAIHNQTLIHLYRLESDKAVASAEKGVALSEQQGYSFLSTWGLCMRAWALAMIGRTNASREDLKQVLSVVLQQSRTSRDYLLVFMAEAYLLLEQPLEGLAVLDNIASDSPEKIHEGERLRLRGEFSRLQGNLRRAEHYFHDAISVNTKMNSATFCARAKRSLAQLSAAIKVTGQPEDEDFEVTDELVFRNPIIEGFQNTTGTVG